MVGEMIPGTNNWDKPMCIEIMDNGEMQYPCFYDPTNKCEPTIGKPVILNLNTDADHRKNASNTRHVSVGLN